MTSGAPPPAIDVSLVARLVAGRFPQWAGLPIRPVDPGGWDNRTFRLGDDKCVRLPSARRYAVQVRKEQRWLPKLASQLPLAIPEPVGLGEPAEGYPWHWSVYRWIEGRAADRQRIADVCSFAVTLAGFLTALQKVDPAGGPTPGPHNFFRGGSLTTYDLETRRAIATLGDAIDGDAALAVWRAALDAPWDRPPVWLHGDVAATNMLVRSGQLVAVIDFGCAGVGDPACDLTIAWTLFWGSSRDAFRHAVRADDATWSRARGWALWKGLITVVEHLDHDPTRCDAARAVIDAVVDEIRPIARGRR